MTANEKELALAREIEKVKSERLTTRIVLHFKDGQLAGAEYEKLPFIK